MSIDERMSRGAWVALKELARFELIKRSWRGAYERTLFVSDEAFFTLSPRTRAVTNVWRFDKLISVSDDERCERSFTFAIRTLFCGFPGRVDLHFTAPTAELRACVVARLRTGMYGEGVSEAEAEAQSEVSRLVGDLIVAPVEAAASAASSDTSDLGSDDDDDDAPRRAVEAAIKAEVLEAAVAEAEKEAAAAARERTADVRREVQAAMARTAGGWGAAARERGVAAEATKGFGEFLEAAEQMLARLGPKRIDKESREPTPRNSGSNNFAQLGIADKENEGANPPSPHLRRARSHARRAHLAPQARSLTPSARTSTSSARCAWRSASARSRRPSTAAPTTTTRASRWSARPSTSSSASARPSARRRWPRRSSCDDRARSTRASRRCAGGRY